MTTPTRTSPTRSTTAPPAIPFFVGELVRLLQDEGKLGNATSDAPVPEGVRDVLRTRLSRLPEEAISVLTAGAIAGREFDVALVAHVCGIDEDRALDLVEAAWMAGIVDEAHDGLGHFRFSHELVRETLVDGLTRCAASGCTGASVKRSKSCTANGTRASSPSVRTTSPRPRPPATR